MLELEDHVELVPGRVGVELRLVDRDARHLADGQELLPPSGEDLAVHLLEELVDARPIRVVLGAGGKPAMRVRVG